MTADIVIGAASGVGEAVARQLMPTSDRLLLADLDAPALDRLGEELGCGVELHRCDVSSRDDLVALAAAAGGVHRLIVTAGLSPTMAPGRRIIAVDLVGPAHVVDVFQHTVGPGSVGLILTSLAARLVAPAPKIDHVLDHPRAESLLDDLVAAGVDIDDPELAYSIAKHGAVRLVERSAAAWGVRSARLLSLSPGIVDTPMGRQETDAHPGVSQLVAGSPLGRAISADEVANVAAFLVSPAASAMTGTDVLVDGGIVATIKG